MSKKKGIFDIQIEQPLIQVRKHEEKRNDLTVEKALSVILKQLEVGAVVKERYTTTVQLFITLPEILKLSIW